MFNAFQNNANSFYEISMINYNIMNGNMPCILIYDDLWIRAIQTTRIPWPYHTKVWVMKRNDTVSSLFVKVRE